MSTYELYKASETCTVCLSIQQLSCVPSTRKFQLSESNGKKVPHPPPNITSPTKQHPSSPISFKLWLQVRYLFFILTKQRFENNVNFLLNILSCWHEEEGEPVYLYFLCVSGKIQCGTRSRSDKLSQMKSL